MNNELIVVKQLPIIEEQLQTISKEIQDRVSLVLSMDCTEENYKEIKKYRSELSKMFADLEERRKNVKKLVLSPYEQFEEIYKTYVTNVFKPADEEIKTKIQSVEAGIKQEKKNSAVAYFNEYAESVGIDFVTFDSMQIDVTMSVSLKKLKETAKLFLDKIIDDLKLIEIQTYKEEILVEYKKSLNVAQAIRIVNDRHEAIEAERKRLEEARLEAEQKAAAETIVDEVIAENAESDSFTAPVEVDVPTDKTVHSDEPVAQKIYQVSFCYRTTSLDSIREIKAIMERNGTYEQL